MDGEESPIQNPRSRAFETEGRIPYKGPEALTNLTYGKKASEVGDCYKKGKEWYGMRLGRYGGIRLLLDLANYGRFYSRYNGQSLAGLSREMT